MSAPDSPKTKWYYNIWIVLLMLFVVLGPFGLPLLWKSPRFSTPMKWMLTAATLLYTVWLVMATMAATQAVVQHLNDLQSVLR